MYTVFRTYFMAIPQYSVSQNKLKPIPKLGEYRNSISKWEESQATLYRNMHKRLKLMYGL